MLTRFALAALTLAAVATPAAAQTWKIDTAHSTARFTVRHMMVSNVHGSFGKVEGTVVFDGSNVAGIKADATVDTTTITLQGYYPLILTGMRAVVGATTYTIVSPQSDSQDLITKLICETLQ